MFHEECDGGCCWHELTGFKAYDREYKWLCCFCGTLNNNAVRPREHGPSLVAHQKFIHPEDWTIWRRQRERELKNELAAIDKRRAEVEKELKDEA